LALTKEASNLAQQLFGNNTKKCSSVINRLVDICTQAQGKDLLLIHNPGGWGGTPLENCLDWERSIVEGATTTLEQLGCNCLFTQYFRGGRSWWSHLRNLREQTVFFFGGQSEQVRVMASELRFITRYLDHLKVIMVGISQGAAFSNAVMRELGNLHQMYSIELGIFFAHMSRRVVTERTLAIDSNGLVPDPVANRNLKAGFKAYITAPSRWIKYRLQGKPETFSYCINVPGHDYRWEYPEVKQKIIDFLKTNFGIKSNLEAGIS